MREDTKKICEKCGKKIFSYGELTTEEIVDFENYTISYNIATEALDPKKMLSLDDMNVNGNDVNIVLQNYFTSVLKTKVESKITLDNVFKGILSRHSAPLTSYISQDEKTFKYYIYNCED
ncbi:MAG: hypothetical protein LBF97_00520 [Elusimicrobiota bacterium]|jgi:hypothetical protein|nr:hypothetical protein [Elusimicrobiota bacterium]